MNSNVFISIIFLFAVSLNSAASTAYITLIIDDMGYKFKDDMRVIGLPAPVVCAIMPHGPHSTHLAQLAYEHNKEVILHLPMQALEHNELLGEGALTLDMNQEKFISTLKNNFARVPHAIGLNNHMGSLLTQHPGHMQWLMNAIKQKGLIYIDSLTSKQSVASYVARENKIPYLIRDVFIDNERTELYIHKRFNDLILKAKRNGSAIGIGHPHRVTIDVISKFIIAAKESNIKIISLQEMLKFRAKEL